MGGEMREREGRVDGRGNEGKGGRKEGRKGYCS